MGERVDDDELVAYWVATYHNGDKTPNVTTGEHFGLTPNHVAVRIYQLRQKGWPIPKAHTPYGPTCPLCGTFYSQQRIPLKRGAKGI